MLRDGKYIREPLPKIGAHYVPNNTTQWEVEDYAMQRILLHEDLPMEESREFPVSSKELLVIALLGSMLVLFFTG